ncbi:hypothetical protein H2200_008222 [Cladophialophora chaetospira]|uniref:Uncharacterized protein n=1 Tax=Cladophialophora chaetospira TaxID=386627 RepID=A0AA39CG97_9EURO|nr:hypothetical protein H2200_008222 [Cladophialophora chaetospira]
MPTLDGDNVTGALMFFAYMVAALVLTGLICRDLLNEYSTTRRECHTQSRDKNGNETKGRRSNETQAQVSIIAALATLSFAALSYHMLNFLIQSYQSWAPSDSLRDVSMSKIWRWSTKSTLFQDFAETINNDPGRFWWTNLALTYTFGWNVYMTVEGARHSIPHLWAYFLLDQILPVSFTQNVFCLALLMRREKSDTTLRTLNPSSPGLQVLLVTTLVGILRTGPSSVGTASFLPLVLITRALVLAPVLLLRPRNSQTEAGVHSQAQSSSRASRLGQHESRWALALTIASIALQIAKGLSESSITELWTGLNSSPAVSALGYDALIGMVSLGVFMLMDDKTTAVR